MTCLQTSAVALLMLLPTFGLGTEVVEPAKADEGPITMAVGSDEPLITVSDGLVRLHPADEQGVGVVDFLEAAQETLGRPISYDPMELGDVRLHLMGSPSCSTEDFRDFFDKLLRSHGFLAYDAGLPGSDTIVVSNLGMGLGSSGRSSLSSQIIDAARLDEQPARRTALYTTAFMLEHLQGRSLMATFMPLLDTRFESMRNVESSNSLVVTVTSLDQLRQIRDLLATMDVPGPDGRLDNAGRLTALEADLGAVRQDLAALKQELAQLKAAR